VDRAETELSLRWASEQSRRFGLIATSLSCSILVAAHSRFHTFEHAVEGIVAFPRRRSRRVLSSRSGYLKLYSTRGAVN
jgi:hypothetical protein